MLVRGVPPLAAATPRATACSQPWSKTTFSELLAPQVDLPGGPLLIEWSEADNHVYMTGPAQLVFEGAVPV